MIHEVNSSKELRQFIRFPHKHYMGHPFWLPPLFIDERNFFKPEKNKPLAHSDVILFTAWMEGKMTGRIMGIISHDYNVLKGEKRARFFKFECIHDPGVSHALIHAVEEWARKKGMEEIIGPFGFSDKDPQGFLISGFDRRAVIIAPYNYSYYQKLVENEGYTKEVDLVEYLIPVPEKIPEFYSRIYQRVTRNTALECVEFRKKKDMKPFIIPVLRLMNETFSDIFGYYPLDEEEMKKFASDYMMVLDPEFVKIVTDQGNVISFFIAMPDLGPALQKAKGKLLPFGIFYLQRDLKRTDYLILMLGGISAAYQGKGLDVLMGTKMLESASKRGIKLLNSHLELETNLKIRAEMEKMGGEVCKTYRIFKKTI